jgi:hypothetical protein
METNQSDVEPLWLFINRLEALGVPYMITGATAAILYGAPRMTNDLDLVLQLSQAAADRLPGLFPPAIFYLPPPDVIQVECRRPNRGHFNIIHMPSGYKTDVYLAGADPLHAWGLERRRRVELDHGSACLAPPEYVILRKLEFYTEGGSQKHLEDIRSIIQTTGPALDHSFLQSEIARRGLTDAWLTASSQQ